MLSELARSLQPYKAGEQPRDKTYIKLNTNENPYPPSPAAEKALHAFESSDLRLYCDPQCTLLRDALAAKEGVKRENIFVGNGSDEVLAMAFLALFNRDTHKPVRFADVTYSFYPVYCALYGIPYERVPLTEDWRLFRAGYEGAGGIVIANPNAPTSVWEDVSEFIGRSVPVILDEAYVDFAGKPSLAKEAAASENAVVVKTFSKSYALAGARCGYAVAGEEIIDGLFRIKDSFNSYTVNSVTQAVAKAAVQDGAYFGKRVAQVVQTRDAFREKLLAKGYDCPPSATNFLFASVPGGDGEKEYLRLKQNGVLVRHWNAPRIADRLRITVG
ncbi:MAG: aminotransferase class I/II-fold pyridoxal phosphate-dependent enzyme, partial [Clostridiales bacterium]|nr:aminotransferase class I/II-fold pyridoxal phosphate-dependent enzyme [Clostridiales bacterium]